MRVISVRRRELIKDWYVTLVVGLLALSAKDSDHTLVFNHLPVAINDIGDGRLLSPAGALISQSHGQACF
jgi:hypothetical protein